MPVPSAEDDDLTARLRFAAEVIGVAPRDHVIVASGGFYSYVREGAWRTIPAGRVP